MQWEMIVQLSGVDSEKGDRRMPTSFPGTLVSLWTVLHGPDEMARRLLRLDFSLLELMVRGWPCACLPFVSTITKPVRLPCSGLYCAIPRATPPLHAP
jgi:hypothetical protein